MVVLTEKLLPPSGKLHLTFSVKKKFQFAASQISFEKSPRPCELGRIVSPRKMGCIMVYFLYIREVIVFPSALISLRLLKESKMMHPIVFDEISCLSTKARSDLQGKYQN